MNMPVLLIANSLVAALSIIFVKEYTIYDNYWYLFLTVLCYLVILILNIKLFKISDISDSYTALQIAQILIIVSVGICYYHEKVNTEKILGITMALFATYLLM